MVFSDHQMSALASAPCIDLWALALLAARAIRGEPRPHAAALIDAGPSVHTRAVRVRVRRLPAPRTTRAGRRQRAGQAPSARSRPSSPASRAPRSRAGSSSALPPAATSVVSSRRRSQAPPPLAAPPSPARRFRPGAARGNKESPALLSAGFGQGQIRTSQNFRVIIPYRQYRTKCGVSPAASAHRSPPLTQMCRRLAACYHVLPAMGKDGPCRLYSLA